MAQAGHSNHNDAPTRTTAPTGTSRLDNAGRGARQGGTDRILVAIPHFDRNDFLFA